MQLGRALASDSACGKAQSAAAICEEAAGDRPLLPPGYRFHPTDEELVVYYLANKVADFRFTVAAIADVDLNKCEPWELPERAKMGEKEWYFFSLKDRKYPTGLRTNRATMAGYWKATGKDREVMSLARYGTGYSFLVGMKKTLVFYKGRAPRGEKTNWIMHEYRLEGESALLRLSKLACKDEWVVCRVFKKSTNGKKTPFDAVPEVNDRAMPALLESSPTHLAGVTNSSEEMSGGNTETEQKAGSLSEPVCGSLCYDRGCTTSECPPPQSSLVLGYGSKPWVPMATISEMDCGLTGFRCSRFGSGGTDFDGLAYLSPLPSFQIPGSLIHRLGIEAGLTSAELYPALELTSELRTVLQQSPNIEEVHKRDISASMECQSTKLMQVYEDASSWQGSIVTTEYNHEIASARSTSNINGTCRIPHSAPAHHVSNRYLACAESIAINEQANHPLGSSHLRSPSQLYSAPRAVIAERIPQNAEPAWASQY